MPKCECLKTKEIGKSAAKPRIEEGSTTRCDEGNTVGLQAIGNSKQ